MSHTPRFTAKAPDSRALPRHFRLERCVSVAACDAELRILVERMSRTTHPETVAGLHADVDEVLDVRQALACAEADALAALIAHEE